MQPIDGTVQHYAWGDESFIPTLLGVEPDGRPWAELWLGTHPNGPSHLTNGEPLEDLTGPLPYLLKVLSAAQPLSLQTHPNTEQAVDGFARGVYPDDRAKPELLYALTPLVALCGVRPVEASRQLLTEIGSDDLADTLVEHGPGEVLRRIYRREIDSVALLDACVGVSRIETDWICRLRDRYPGDPSVAAALLLNLVELTPGQVLRLDAGNLHAYLDGSGVELMGASDNVVRGGLTVKPVDVDELLAILDPTPLADPVLPPAQQYELPTAGVGLTVLDAGNTHLAVDHELAVDANGGTWWYAPGDEVTVDATTFVAGRLDDR